MLTRDEAWAHLCAWTETDSLRKHARAVEIVMRAAAGRYGPTSSGEPPSSEPAHAAGERPEHARATPDTWGIAGMLHDADYERWPEDHPNRIVAWLRERGEEAIAYAVSAHYTRWNVEHRSPLDRALLACDELTGFVVACCLVRPDGIATLNPQSVKKKLKDKSFAAKVDRGEIAKGIELLAVTFEEHVQFVIDALRPHAGELGIEARNQ